MMSEQEMKGYRKLIQRGDGPEMDPVLIYMPVGSQGQKDLLDILLYWFSMRRSKSRTRAYLNDDKKKELGLDVNKAYPLVAKSHYHWFSDKGVSVNSLTNLLNSLREKGWIETVQQKWNNDKTNHFQLTPEFFRLYEEIGRGRGIIPDRDTPSVNKEKSPEPPVSGDGNTDKEETSGSQRGGSGPVLYSSGGEVHGDRDTLYEEVYSQLPSVHLPDTVMNRFDEIFEFILDEKAESRDNGDIRFSSKGDQGIDFYNYVRRYFSGYREDSYIKLYTDFTWVCIKNDFDVFTEERPESGKERYDLDRRIYKLFSKFFDYKHLYHNNFSEFLTEYVSWYTDRKRIEKGGISLKEFLERVDMYLNDKRNLPESPAVVKAESKAYKKRRKYREEAA